MKEDMLDGFLSVRGGHGAMGEHPELYSNPARIPRRRAARISGGELKSESAEPNLSEPEPALVPRRLRCGRVHIEAIKGLVKSMKKKKEGEKEMEALEARGLIRRNRPRP